MNWKMWASALTTMPHVEKSAWVKLDVISKWLLATRSAVLIMTLMASMLAGVLAYQDGVFHSTYWLVLTCGLVFAHATNNLLNDWVDSVKGVDKDNYYRNKYGVHVIEDKLLNPQQFFAYVAFTAAIALACGGYLIWQQGEYVVELMLLGSFFVLFYTWPLKYWGLGEIAVLLVWGPLMIAGGYYVMAGSVSLTVILVSILFSLGPTTVIFGKHIDKLTADKQKGVNTLPVILGDNTARLVAKGLLWAQYGLVLVLVAFDYHYAPLLLVFFNWSLLSSTLKTFSTPKPDSCPDDYPEHAWPLWFSAYAFTHNRRYSGIFILALLIKVIFL